MKAVLRNSLLGILLISLAACGSSSSSETSSAEPACSKDFRSDFDGLIESFAAANGTSPSSSSLAEASRVCTAFIAKHGAGNCRAYSNDKNAEVLVLGQEIQKKCNEMTAAAKANPVQPVNRDTPSESTTTESPVMTDYYGNCTSNFLSAYNSALIQVNYWKQLRQIAASRAVQANEETVVKCDALAKFGKGTCTAQNLADRSRVTLPSRDLVADCDSARSGLEAAREAQEKEEIRTGKRVPLTELKPTQLVLTVFRPDDLNAELNAPEAQKQVYARATQLKITELKSDDVSCRFQKPLSVPANHKMLTEMKVASISRKAESGIQEWTFKTSKHEMHIVCQAPQDKVLALGDIRLAIEWILSVRYSK